MKDLTDIREIENIQHLNNEYDLQKALLLHRKLRLMTENNPDLIPIRKRLFNLIHDYESIHWSDSEKITDTQFEESEIAEILVESERKFIQKRKETIINRLKMFDMNQQDLGILLEHRKSYMSEIINGVLKFSLKDLIIVHRVLGIELSKLIPTYLHNETRKRVEESINRLNKPKLKFKKEDLMMV
ncbi:MAG: transcriptional regulator [Bacteroidota bacterium]|nr:transcriptional regulator [Bacteroidota bacterium]